MLLSDTDDSEEISDEDLDWLNKEKEGQKMKGNLAGSEDTVEEDELNDSASGQAHERSTGRRAKPMGFG